MGKIEKILSVLLIAACLAVPAQAAYENIYQNTGDMRADIVGVALTQVGYTEGANNDTKYGDWMNLSNHPWCAIFISWCARQAQIPTSILRTNGLANPSGFGLTDYVSGSDYTPRTGDLFFKKNFTHAGLVYYVDGQYFYTVEGNTSDGYLSDGYAVMVRKRTISEYYFASPNYGGSCAHSYQKQYSQEHPHKEYYTCSSCGHSYETGNTAPQESCHTCRQTRCSHSWETQQRFEPTCSQTGEQQLQCSLCGAEKTQTLSKTDTHRYTDWQSEGEETHRRICQDCQQAQTQEHLWQDYQKTAAGHSRLCSECGQAEEESAHSFPEGCEAGCPDCGYTQPDHRFADACQPDCLDCGFTRQVSHSYSDTPEANEQGHWYSCNLCKQQSPLQEHTPGPAATQESAQLCTDCGFELVPPLPHIHQFPPYTQTRATHSGSCSCGETLEEPHSWDMATGSCSVCAMVPEQMQQQDWSFVWYAGAGVFVAALVIVLIVCRKKDAKKEEERELVSMG